jgi:sugar phosphate isomerase/epimerase
LEKLIPHVAKMGFDCVEVIGERPHGWPLDYDRDSRKALLSICRKENVRIASFCTGFGYFLQTGLADERVDVRNESRDYIRSLIALTNDLEGDFTMIVPGRVLVGEDIENGWKNAVTEIAELSDYAHDIGVKLVFENMLAPSELVYNPDTIMRLVKDVGKEGIGITLDVGHLNVMGIPLSAFLETMKESIVNVHISDNDGSNDSHGPIGSGNIDFKSVVDDLKRSGYDGLLTFEIVSSWRWDIGDADRAVSTSREYLNRILETP